jgi:hypothetical protein
LITTIGAVGWRVKEDNKDHSISVDFSGFGVNRVAVNNYDYCQRNKRGVMYNTHYVVSNGEVFALGHDFYKRTQKRVIAVLPT